MVELYLYSPISLHGVVLNQLSTGTALLLFFFFLKWSTMHSIIGDLENTSVSPRVLDSVGSVLHVIFTSAHGR
jgi:hypothetical protein